MMTRLSLCLLLASLVWAADDTRLPDAAMRGDRTAVNTLLQAKVDVNTAQGDGMTALHWAASAEDLEMAQALVKAGAGLKATTRIDHATPLLTAARSGNAKMIALLAEAGSDVNAASVNGTTPLMLAAASGHADAVKILIDHGADVNAKEKTWNETPLMFAAALNRAEAITLLVQHGANVNATAKVQSLDAATPAQDAAEGRGEAPAAADGAKAAGANGAKGAVVTDGAKGAGGTETRKRVQAAGNRRRAVTAMGGFTSLHFAAREGQMDAVKALVAAGANVNELSPADKMSAITEAISNGHLDIGKFLLDHGADPNLTNADGVSPLLATIDSQWVNKQWYPQPSVDQEKTSYLDLMKDLLDKGANPNEQGQAYLWYRKGHDVGDESGATPFWRAAEANDIAAMKLLMAHGANPNLASKNGTTPLMVAAGMGYGFQTTVTVADARMATIKYLVEECGADVNARDNIGYTALHGAAFRGDNDMVLYLVSKGGDITARSQPDKGRDHFGGEGGGNNPLGDTVADYANGPSMNTLVFPDTVALVEKLGSDNSHNCRSELCVLKTVPDSKKPAVASK
jgi:uncharacterized protein